MIRRTFPLLLLVAGAACSPPTPTEGPDAQLVTPEVMQQALTSRPPARLTLSDEIDFFQGRLADRGEDRLARTRLFAAYRLRFQAYQQDGDLRAAEEALADLPAAALPGARAALDLDRHRFRSAEASAERALAAAHGDAREDARRRLFDVYLAVGRYDDAVAQLERTQDRDGFGYVVRAARLQDRRGDVAGARALQARAVELARTHAEPPAVQAWSLVSLAHLEHHSGHPARAIPLLEEALRLLPGYPAAFEALGWIAYGVDRDLPTARVLFDRAVEGGGHLSLLLTLADIAALEGDDAEAGRIRGRFLTAARADTATTRLYRPALALQLAEHDATVGEALRLAEADLRQRRSAEAVSTYAWVLHRAGRPAAARTLFAEALEWGMPAPAVHLLAGRAAWERGERSRARHLLEYALSAETEIGPADAERIRTLLDGGSGREGSRDGPRGSRGVGAT
ncbi:MAG: hypothetical protein R3E98_00450 [Gemmatimonadota bacterium]|nr:hypothetical protein [Gemmatimonadota bacterium]